MTTDHYETLGVPRDASQDDIKRAVRAKRRLHHTDLEGGDKEKIQAVNAAYDVLGDPERRARYDSGQDHAGPSLEDQATSMLVSAFANVLDTEGNIVVVVREKLREIKQGGIANLSNLRHRIAKLTARRSLVRVKAGENIVHALIDGQLQGLHDGLAKVERLLPVVDVALKLLDNYESAESVGITIVGLDSMMMRMPDFNKFYTGV